MAVLGRVPEHELGDVLASVLPADLIAGGSDADLDAALRRWLSGEPSDPWPSVASEGSAAPGSAAGLRQAPGPGSAATLAGFLGSAGHSPSGLAAAGELSDADLVEFVVAAERLSRWAQWVRGVGAVALQQRWTAANPADRDDEGEQTRRLARVERRERRCSPLVYGPDDTDLAEAFVVAETALVAGVSESMARQWLDVATAVTGGRLPLCGAGLRAGRLDWSKVRAVNDLTWDRAPQTAAAAEALVIPDALLPDPDDPGDPDRGDAGGPVIRTVPDLKGRLRAALLLLDGPADTERAADEHSERRVVCRATSPSIGELLAVLPLDQIALIAARLDTAAVQARRDRDPRTADQVRADTLTDQLTHGLLPDLPDVTPVSELIDPATTSKRRPVPPPARVQVIVTLSLETLLGLRDDPGHLDRYGPIAADLARDLATHGTWRCAPRRPSRHHPRPRPKHPHHQLHPRPPPNPPPARHLPPMHLPRLPHPRHPLRPRPRPPLAGRRDLQLQPAPRVQKTPSDENPRQDHPRTLHRPPPPTRHLALAPAHRQNPHQPTPTPAPRTRCRAQRRERLNASLESDPVNARQVLDRFRPRRSATLLIKGPQRGFRVRVPRTTSSR